MDGNRFDLSGRVALITGSGRGIGLAIGHALAEQGAAIVLQDIEQARADDEAKKIVAGGGKAVGLGGDLTDLTLPRKLVDQTLAHFGGLHILINNGSIQTAGNWLESDVETMRRQIDANLISPILLCQLVTPILRAQQFGRIINIGSIQQKVGNPWMLAYSLGKAALEKLTTGLARDLSKDQVTVNTIAPGWFAGTHRNRESLKSDQDITELGKKHIPLGRLGQPEDCAGLAILLCSKAGEYITGQSIYVDGGMGLK